MHIGTRCFERDRGQDTIRGGVVIAHLAASCEVLVATSWGRRTKGRRANVPVLETCLLLEEDIDPATVAPCSFGERVQLARAIAAVFGDRRSTSRSLQDERDLAVIAELMNPYAAGMDSDAQLLASVQCEIEPGEPGSEWPVVAPEERVGDLMQQLEDSVAAARVARAAR